MAVHRDRDLVDRVGAGACRRDGEPATGQRNRTGCDERIYGLVRLRIDDEVTFCVDADIVGIRLDRCCVQAIAIMADQVLRRGRTD